MYGGYGESHPPHDLGTWRCRVQFTPGSRSYAGDGQTTILRSCQVRLLDERELVTGDGRVTGTGRSGEFSKAFRCDFTRRYEAVSRRHGQARSQWGI